MTALVPVSTVQAAGPPTYQSLATATRGSNGTSLTINKPTGTTQGDLLIAILSKDGTGAINTPSGWTLINEGSSGTGSGNIRLGVFYKVAGASEPSSYTITWSDSEQAVGAILRYSNFCTGNPINVSGSATGGSNTPTAPSVTTTVADTLVLRIYGADGDLGAGAGYPSGHTGRFSIESNSGSDTCSGGAADRTQTAIGATGTAAFNLTGTGSERWRAVTLAIKPNPDCTITAPSSVCANSTGNSASVPTAGTGATYTWNITNGSITGGQNTRQITWSAGSTSPVTIGITITVSGCSCTNTGVNVTVNPLPVCTITAPSSVCANSTGNSASVPTAGVGATYNWTITNGSITGGQNTRQITWSAGSTSPVTIRITITDANGCSCTNTGVNVTVNPLPVCTITAPSSVCANSVGNTASVPNAGAGATYTWTISNGTITAGGTTNSITYTAGPSGNVTLGITITASGCSCTNTGINVPINPVPSCTITPTPASVCANSTGNHASVTAVTGATYTWTISNGTITAGGTTNSITYTAGPSGNVTLGITITASGCQCTNSTQVTVITIDCTITAPSSVYANSVGNTASVPDAGGGATYTWSITNGTITAGQGTRSITWRAGSTGPVTIGITVTVSGCQCTNSKQITITTPSSLAVSINGNTAFCEGGSTTLTANAAGGAPPYTYDWTASTAAGSYQGNEYIASGTGTVAVTVTDSAMCSSKVVSDNNTMVTRGNGATPHNAVLAWVHDNWWSGLDYNFGYPNNTAQWIWESYQVVHPEAGDVVYFERSFDIATAPTNATLRITCDNGYEAYMNGIFLGSAQLTDYNGIPWEDSDLTDNWVASSGWQSVESYSPTLQIGTNILEIRAANEHTTGGTVTANPGGVIYELTYEYHCTASNSVNVIVNPTPTASASSNSPVEEGNTILLTGGLDGMSSYSWTGPNSFISDQQSPSIPNATIAMAGEYILTVTNTYGCQNNASVNITINPASIPTVTEIEIYEDPGCTKIADSMTPQFTYYARLWVTLSNNLEHLQTVQVTLFYNETGADDMTAPTSGNTQTCAILTCGVGSTPTWTISSGAPTSWTIETGGCVQPPLNATSGAWIFAFKPGRVATESISPADWDAQGKAIRNPTQTGELYVRNKDMNWYGEITVNTPSVDWGEVPLGLKFEDAPNPEAVSIKYIANGNYYEDIRSEDWVGGSETVTLSTGDPPTNPGEFALMANDINEPSSAITVTSSYNHINDTRGLTTEAGVIVTNNSLWLSLSEVGIAPVIYGGTIYYQIAER
jgi:hypothetical protein